MKHKLLPVDTRKEAKELDKREGSKWERVERERGKWEKERYEGRQKANGNGTERGGGKETKVVNGKERREWSQGGICKRGVDGRKRWWGKYDGLQKWG